MRSEKASLLKNIPKVDKLLADERLRDFVNNKGLRVVVVDCAREVLNRIRNDALVGKLEQIPSDEEIVGEIRRKVEANLSYSLKPVINATGVILHTNLGRAPLSKVALENILRVSSGYSNLEYDLLKGERGRRYVHVERLLCELCGAESALVVNNNAAAVMLALKCFAQNREVIVSRGELIEIGGSFRMPEIMAQSGAVLVEVGTTNRTHLFDYERAISERTAMILKVHPSNYRIVGFTSVPSTSELASLAHKHELILMEDLGSGCLVDLSQYGLYGEPTVKSVIEAGADIVTFSGDKLLGGPQMGIIVGKRKFLEPMQKHPLLRAIRVDKLSLAALEATLKLYVLGELEKLPVFRMLAQDMKTLRRRANEVAKAIKKLLGEGADVWTMRSSSKVGGGSLPQAELESFVVAIKPHKLTPGELAKRLAKVDVPVVARIQDDALLLDLRTVFPEQQKVLVESVKKAVGQD